MQILLPRLRPDQWEIASHPAKIKVVCMGRRWGKTVMAGAVALAVAAGGGAVAWIAPTYRNSRVLWRFIERAVGDVSGSVTISRGDRSVSFPGGGSVAVFSADGSADALRGESFDLVVIDEAARVSGEVWQDVIQPTLADRDGRAILISTPKRKNWFFHEYTRALLDGVHSRAWSAPSSANPSPSIRAAYERARTIVPAKTFRQEWNAEFVEDGGEVFRNVRAVSTAEALSPPEVLEQGRFVAGVDWGRTDDSTVISVFDTVERAQVYLDRFSDVGYELQTARLRAAYARWGLSAILAEANSMGGPLIERLQGEGIPIQPFWTTNATKTQLVGDFALAMELGTIRLLKDDVQIAELEAFEEHRTPTGVITFSAPGGLHDDTVMASALGWRAASAGGIFA